MQAGVKNEKLNGEEKGDYFFEPACLKI